MLGIKHIKFDAMTYVLHYKNGKVRKEGRGLSFFYYEPKSSIVAIPMGSNDLPFIFPETTKDYQTVSIQGEVSYHIEDPRKLADIFDFTVDKEGKHKKNDLEKLNQRIINMARSSISAFILSTDMKTAIHAAKDIETTIASGLQSAEALGKIGIQITGVNVSGVRPTPDMRKALETETREKLQQEADQAIYERRNFAVEQERIIKESELNTEIAVEEKHKQIVQKKMESDVLKAENDKKLREMNLGADIAVEKQREEFITLKSTNDRKEAETQGYVLETKLKPYQELDWKLLTAIKNNIDPKMNIALAFRELAENADKIGNLNISPDLLDSLLNTPKEKS
ncbi:SPFH domain-containing protein [Maribacter sp. 4G9]|uniref:SPFH domain-containing protein n=1 Tax=Maribacter sp. 4G9 TaxID=1889777 RepID=UPI000C15F637|nr:SPFH domain-containing protein [Maribacter sp. 4G9]PIB38409.1 membrane protease subunit, stomatin/prohibitin [Maribacter sp. 4G9]